MWHAVFQPRAIAIELDADNPVERYNGTQHYEQIHKAVLLTDDRIGTFYLAINGRPNKWDREGEE